MAEWDIGEAAVYGCLWHLWVFNQTLPWQVLKPQNINRYHKTTKSEARGRRGHKGQRQVTRGLGPLSDRCGRQVCSRGPLLAQHGRHRSAAHREDWHGSSGALLWNHPIRFNLFNSSPWAPVPVIDVISSPKAWLLLRLFHMNEQELDVMSAVNWDKSVPLPLVLWGMSWIVPADLLASTLGDFSWQQFASESCGFLTRVHSILIHIINRANVLLGS